MGRLSFCLMRFITVGRRGIEVGKGKRDGSRVHGLGYGGAGFLLVQWGEVAETWGFAATFAVVVDQLGGQACFGSQDWLIHGR